MRKAERWILGAALAALILVPVARYASGGVTGIEVSGSTTVSVTRGPYLQMGTPSSAIVRWRTDVANDSRVRYGSTPGSLSATADVATSTTEHIVTVTGLAPDTTYYYSVGTAADTLAGGDATYFFHTYPLTGAGGPIRTWVIGDSGTANASAQIVRNAYVNFAGARPTDVWLMLGDNAYNNGTDAEYQAAVFAIYPTILRNTFLWPTIGNHDTAGSSNPPASLPYYQIFSLPTNGESGGLPSGTEDYYSFDRGNIHFVCLDSMTSDRSPTAAMATWLRNDLGAMSQDWIIAFWHHPPYTKGSHDSDTETELVQMRQNIVPILEDYGVDLVLTGHSHSYERSFLLDGHYGTSTTLTSSMIKDSGSGRPSETGAYQKPTSGNSPHEGAVYAVAGSSGQTSGGSLDHPAMFISLNLLGSMVLDVDGNRLDAKFLRESGAIDDSFTIQKGGAPATPTPTPTRTLTPIPPSATPTRTATPVAPSATPTRTPTPLAPSATATPTSTAAPAAPSGLTATGASRNRIDLVWTDNSNNETAFEIQRSKDAATWTLLASPGANSVAYSDSGLTPNKLLYYRVRAVNLSGASAWSNTASARTPKK
jgi:acid phosphatase type 7